MERGLGEGNQGKGEGKRGGGRGYLVVFVGYEVHVCEEVEVVCERHVGGRVTM